jgi:hypothetical protein
MSIVPEDCDERQLRVGRMIEEFREAQSRRLARAITVKSDDLVELQKQGEPQHPASKPE